jgi:hypothetical protein
MTKTHAIKKRIPDNPDMRIDVNTGDVFDVRSNEWIGNLLD